MKLSLPEIRVEPFNIITSIKNIKKMHAYQLEQTKTLEELKENSNPIEQFVSDYEIKYLEQSEKFIREILILNEEEVDKLESLERDKFMLIQSKIILTLQGYSSEAIEKIFSESDQSSKK